MKISVDLFNRYIDNELSEEELVQFNKLLNQDLDAVKKIKALQFVENSAGNIETFNAPDGFTRKIMMKIKPQLSKQYKKNYFFRIIISFFTVLFFSFSGYVLYLLANLNTGSNLKGSVFTKLNFFSEKEIYLIEKFLTNPSILLVTSSVTLLLLLSLYFIIESNLFANQKSKSF